MIKVLHVVGARPQFMKLLPLYLEMSNNQIDQEILHTGQHFDEIMSDVFFSQLGIPKPNYNLNINNLSHGAMTGRMIEEIEKILLNNNYDFLIIYGDTNSTLAGAIAAKKLGIKVVHIESGVRNHDNSMPEEINRILSDRISDLLFCNTKHTLNNLVDEGHKNFNSKIEVSGDLMLDCLKIFESKFIEPDIKNYILITCHRASNTDLESLKNILNALNILSEKHKIVFPIHPRTKKIIKEHKINLNFNLDTPKDYLTFMGLVKGSKYVLTDSGGLVREAYWMKKKSLFILDNPVWPELNEAGVSINCRPTTTSILTSFNKLESMDSNFIEGILGEGTASKHITESILRYE
jgi:UDP-GlcNAc3NAcA epimerase